MDIDNFVSTAIESQFPQFYREDGPTFVAFVKAYYEWMEQEGYAINASRNLLTYNDIDTTIDSFVDNFKNEFLVNFPAITTTNKFILIKRIKDFYSAKGSTQGLKLLFQLLFNEDIDVYDPGQDIIKASDGVWKIPYYIEVDHNQRSREFINQQITGAKSKATAFVESVHTKIIKNRIIDVINISNIKGKFLYGELITNDGDLLDAPRIRGSLTELIITDGGSNNKIGDVYNIKYSDSGKGGTARVTATVDGTGRVIFKLIDGGTAYTTDNTQIHISNNVLVLSNISSSTGKIDFNTFDKVSQPLINVNYTASTPSNPTYDDLYHIPVKGYNGSTVVANGYIVFATPSSNSFVVNVIDGNFDLATNIKTQSNLVNFTLYNTSNSTATGYLTGSNSVSIGVHDVTNKFYGNGAFITTSDASRTIIANVSSVSTGSGAKFSIGSLTSTESVFLFGDMLSSNNVNGIENLDLIISGSNSNTGLLLGTGSITTNTATNVVTGTGTTFTSQVDVGSGLYISPGNVFIGTVNSISNNISLTLSTSALSNVSTTMFYYNLHQYGFPKDPTAGYNTPMFNSLTYGPYTIGTIASLSSINQGSNYNTNPFVLIRNDLTAPYNRKNLIIELESVSGTFNINDVVNQAYSVNTQNLSINSKIGNFSVGEGVTQSNGTANSYATIKKANSTVVVISEINGTFYSNTDGGQSILGLSSLATANITLISNTTLSTVSTGTVVESTESVIEIKRSSFDSSIQQGTTITSSSGGSAIVSNVYQNDNSLSMGSDAVVQANVSIARGIATELEILDSGHGHLPNDNIELVSDTNPFSIVATANVLNQGIGVGYWVDNKGKLDSDKFITDGNYYQDFSYEVQSKLSLDKYSDILKKIAHVVGTKMFGSVDFRTHVVKPLTTSSSIVLS